MTNKSEWQEANRCLSEEDRRKLGDPPTADEMLAYSRGELSESEEERIRDLLVAYPELARMYAAEVPEAPRPGDPDAVSEDEVRAGWAALQRRLGGSGADADRDADRRTEVQRGRIVFRRYIPTTIAAAFALLFFGLFVHAESRARYHERQGRLPRILGEAQELEPGGRRGGGGPVRLRRNGDAYLVRPRLFDDVRYPHYRIELHDRRGDVLWSNNGAQPDQDDSFQIEIPHGFLRAGEDYQIQVFGVDGDNGAPLGRYDLAAPAE